MFSEDVRNKSELEMTHSDVSNRRGLFTAPAPGVLQICPCPGLSNHLDVNLFFHSF